MKMIIFIDLQWEEEEEEEEEEESVPLIPTTRTQTHQFPPQSWRNVTINYSNTTMHCLC